MIKYNRRETLAPGMVRCRQNPAPFDQVGCMEGRPAMRRFDLAVAAAMLCGIADRPAARGARHCRAIFASGPDT